MMADRCEPVGRDEGELGTLRSVIDGLWAHGGRPALVAVGEEGVEIWTYGELAWQVLGLGRGLRGAGVERGDHVALLAANSKEWVAACLAVISAGAVVVPLDVQLGDGQEHVRSQPDIDEGTVQPAGGGPGEHACWEPVHHRTEPRQLPGCVRGGRCARLQRAAVHVLGGRCLRPYADASRQYRAAVLKRGQNLVWFAEGVRSPTGGLQPFKPGVGTLLSYHPVP